MPSKLPSSAVISYGGKAALVDMMSLPASTVVSPADAAPAVSSPAASLVSAASEEALSAAGSEAAVLSEEAVLPQAVTLSARAAASITERSFFIVYTLFIMCSLHPAVPCGISPSIMLFLCIVNEYL